MYNFNSLGHRLSFHTKIKKHLKAEDEHRLKDYVCKAMEGYDRLQDHPCAGILREAAVFLSCRDWQVGYSESKGCYVCVTPGGDWYTARLKSLESLEKKSS